MSVDCRTYKAKRLAILYMTGSIPDVVDHINGITGDNAFRNLRAATQAQNTRNCRGHKDSKLGIKGLYQMRSGKYNPTICVDGRQIHIGVYTSLDSAIEAREAASKKYYGDFARMGKSMHPKDLF
ncbi:MULTISPECIES: HNH endonuclease [unclassified Pantoea]|uniref:HNH endonuclease n=1 Tax=unclassified Pantoea TaxID=2630326 RepID=UPI00289305E3|nr:MULTISPECIES: HNH endonuclease [unclassified Pantoea]